MTTQIDAAELQRWISDKRQFALVDVLTEECFNAQRLPGARRASVYEVSFLDQIAALAIGLGDPVVLYGAGAGSLDSAVAAEKLERAGFSNLTVFGGGRAEWAEAGGTFEGDGSLPPAAPAPEDRRYAVNPSRSSLEWIGRNLNSTHRGTISIASGHISIIGGTLAEGRVLLDMRSIQNADLQEPMMRQLLESHLKSDDFFDVERFPAAELKLLSARQLPEAAPGTPNCEITAHLTLKAVSRPITFPAIVAAGEHGSLMAIAQIEIDRTQWGVLYGSGRFFRMLGKHLVNDAVLLLVKLVAE